MAPWQEWNDAAELPWHLLEHAAHRGVHDVVQTINAVADEWPALWRRDNEPGGFQWLDANDADHSIYAFVRWDTAGADGRGVHRQLHARWRGPATGWACRGPATGTVVARHRQCGVLGERASRSGLEDDVVIAADRRRVP